MSRIIFDIETLGFPLASFDQETQTYLLRFADNEEKIEDVKKNLNLHPLTAQILCLALYNPDTQKGKVFFQSDKNEEYYSEDKKINFDLRMPLRAVTASNFTQFQNAGWLFQPQLALDINDIGRSGWNIGLVGGLIFSDRRYNQYFYDVAPQYATATRPAYTANGGYAGTQFIVAFNKRDDGYWMGGFMKWDDLNNAVFVDSPLVESKQYFTIGFAVTWVFDKSDKMVKVSND